MIDSKNETKWIKIKKFNEMEKKEIDKWYNIKQDLHV